MFPSHLTPGRLNFVKARPNQYFCRDDLFLVIGHCLLVEVIHEFRVIYSVSSQNAYNSRWVRVIAITWNFLFVIITYHYGGSVPQYRCWVLRSKADSCVIVGLAGSHQVS